MLNLNGSWLLIILSFICVCVWSVCVCVFSLCCVLWSPLMSSGLNNWLAALKVWCFCLQAGLTCSLSVTHTHSRHRPGHITTILVLIYRSYIYTLWPSLRMHLLFTNWCFYHLFKHFFIQSLHWISFFVALVQIHLALLKFGYKQWPRN